MSQQNSIVFFGCKQIIIFFTLLAHSITGILANLKIVLFTLAVRKINPRKKN